jgi:3-hydroxyisobutyrate dehydrogenase-like beta-hydroxyacid dehydrogenase
MAKLQLGFLGIGKMGGLMAQRLLADKHTLTVFDTVEAAMQPLIEAGARRASSPRELADSAEIIFASLPTPDIVKEAALGSDGISKGITAKVFIDTSTTGPSAAAEISRELGKYDIAAIDCPVSGGMAGARDGKLTLMVSGPRSTVDKIQPLLQLLGKPMFVGETPGAAQTVKLANNLLTASAMAITAEALVMGVKAGVDPGVMCDVINVSSGRNTATVDKFPRAVFTGGFDFGFSTGLAYKDVRLCLDEAEALGVPTPVGAAVRQAFAIANAVYGPASDFSCIVRPLEEWARVLVRSAGREEDSSVQSEGATPQLAR